MFKLPYTYRAEIDFDNGSKNPGNPMPKGKVGKVMHEYQEGTLKSGSGKKVRNPKQASAIAISEAKKASHGKY